MRQVFSTNCTLTVFAVAFLLISCSKNELFKPVSQQIATSQEDERIVSAVPDDIVGRYRVSRFIEDGKNETARFTGYRFAFQADSSLIARTNSGQIVEGSWIPDTTGTIITIDISGTGALDRLVGDWQIVEVTDSRMVLRNADGDRVVFARLSN
jgi:hypothetical protein